MSTIYLCSFPKSGRTWLRFILANYFKRYFKINIAVTLPNMFKFIPNAERVPKRGPQMYAFEHITNMPKIICSHKMPPEKNDSILVLRNPHDILVSYFFHLRPKRSIKTFIQNQLPNLMTYLNQWANRNPACVVSYEELYSGTFDSLSSIIKCLDIDIIDKMLVNAIEASTFKRMVKLEIKNNGVLGLNKEINNPEKRRMRRGVIYGYKDYLDTEDIQIIDNALGNLKPKIKEILREHKCVEGL